MKTLLFIALFALILLLPGCNKHENIPNLFEDKINVILNEGKITEIQNEGKKAIGNFTYDQKGLLIDSWYKEDFYLLDEKAEYTYSYNSENQLIQKTGYEPGNMFMSSYTGAMGKKVVYTYDYNSVGKIEKVTVNYDYESNLILNFSRIKTYQYPEEDLIIETFGNVGPAGNSVSGFTEYHYNSDGNIETIEEYYLIDKDNQLSSKTEITYDEMPAPFNPEPGPISKNNMLSKKMTVYNYDEKGVRSIAYTSDNSYKYTYNVIGFPESQIETLPNETKITKYFKY